MRIALVYPPPWKITAPGEPAFPRGEGEPEGYREGDLDADFHQTPYGLFSIGAQAIRAGHQVKVINLSAFPWHEVERLVRGLDADVYGMSMWTANRRGVALLAKCIKAHRPRAHVVVGGPHATPLAAEVLRHHPEIDTVCVGESDLTFMELVDRLAAGHSTKEIAGTVYRDGDRIARARERASIHDLDTLASPQDY